MKLQQRIFEAREEWLRRVTGGDLRGCELVSIPDADFNGAEEWVTRDGNRIGEPFVWRFGVDVGASLEDWESHLREFSKRYKNHKTCECGSAAVGSPNHSDWCPMR